MELNLYVEKNLWINTSEGIGICYTALDGSL